MNKLVENKFEQEDWLAAEKQLSSFDKTVLECLKNLGKTPLTGSFGEKENNNSELFLFPVSGDEVYSSLRNILSEWKIGSLLCEDYILAKVMNKLNDKNIDIEYINAKLNILIEKKLTKGKLKKLHNKIKEILKCNENNKELDKTCLLFEEFLKKIEPTLNIKEKKPTYIKKIDKMRTENMLSKYKNDLTRLMGILEKDYHDTSRQKSPLLIGLNQIKIIELIGITFMYEAKFVLMHPDIYRQNSKLIDVYELIVGIQKFNDSCISYEGKSMFNSVNKEKVSQSMINDLELWLNELIEQYEFDGFKIYDIAPKLFVYSDYDQFIPCKGIKPRKNQIDLINKLKENIMNYPNDGILLILKAPIGSGKTFSTIAIVNLMKTINMEKGDKYELIFCCNLQSVKNQVSNLAYNSGIKFGVGYMKHDKLKIVNHNTCKSDSDRELIICSPNVAEQLLENNTNKYWLFLDEPTIGADNYGSDNLIKNVSVMMNMPKYTILSSATMPEFEDLSELTTNHCKKYPNIHLETIYSGEIQVGCDVKLYDGSKILPHLNCNSKEELINVIERIEKNPFLGRMYTHNVVRQLCKDISNYTSNVPNLGEIFKNVNNLSSEKIRLVAINMLKILIDFDDDVIQNICKINLIEEIKNYDVDYKYLGTTHAYQFQNMNLIATSDPINFSITNFAELLDKLKENNITSSYKLINKYNQDLAVYKKIIEKVKENLNCQDDHNKKSDKVSFKLEKIKKPYINFPLWGQINTIDHINFFAKPHMKYIDKRSIRIHYPLEQLPFDANVPDEIMLLLMCGIGIYSPNSEILDQRYTRSVLDMATNGHLAYLIADESISYGTNYPITRLFVTDEFVDKHSIHTLLQLMGRPGRVGHTYRAEVFIEKNTAKLLLEFSHNKDHPSVFIESNNIQKMFQYILQTRIQNAIDKQKKIEEEQKLLKEKEKMEEIRLFNERQESFQQKLREEHQIEKERRMKEENEKIEQTTYNKLLHFSSRENNYYNTTSEWKVIDSKKKYKYLQN